MTQFTAVPVRRLPLLTAGLLLALPMTFAQAKIPDPSNAGLDRATQALAENLDRQVTHLEALTLEVPEAAQTGLNRAIEAITAALIQDVLAGLHVGPPSELPVLGLPDLPDVVTLPELPDLPELPNLPDLPNVPDRPDLPDLPDLPNRP